MKRGDFKRVAPYIYEIPKAFRADMRVPARFYADGSLLEGALGDKSLDQLVNTATMPGIVKYALAMPDIHQGYGFPIGGVVATELPDGVISPGGVGYDINCGVRLLGRFWMRRMSLRTWMNWRRSCSATARMGLAGRGKIQAETQ